MDTGSRNIRRILLVSILCLCVVAGTVGGVLNYLTDRTESVTNEFVPAKVSCVVEEIFEGGVKNDVKVRNTGNTDAYIRVAIVANFQSDDGKVLATAPKEGEDYLIVWNPYGWEKGTDGFWYYKQPVAPDGVTAMLIESAVALSVPTGYRLNIQVIASAVQAAPDAAVQEAWGITPTNGELIPN